MSLEAMVIHRLMDVFVPKVPAILIAKNMPSW